MKRPASSENVLKRLEAWRNICPDITIRSTFIVGFPGETETHFQHLLDFLEAAQIDRAGCFKYSQVEGAKSNALSSHVDEDAKEERWHRLMSLQAEISRKRLAAKIGTLQEVIIDEVSAQQCSGRTKGDAPDIDGRVIIEGPHHFRQGDIVSLKINDADNFDLYASSSENSESTDNQKQKISLRNL